MPIYQASMKGVPVNLLNAVTTGTGLGISIPISAKNIRVHLRGTGTISGGTISIEESMTPDYAGTWSVLQSISASGLTATAGQVVHIAATIGVIRVRVSSDITGGGSISADLVSD